MRRTIWKVMILFQIKDGMEHPRIMPQVQLGSVRGQRFLRCVWVNCFETLGKNRYGLRIMHVK